MRKHLVTGALGLAALILNPFYACNPFAPSYTYSAKEMKAAVEGTWTLTTEGRSYVFHVKQGNRARQHSSRSMIPSAQACGTRTLVASASACIDSSDMPVVVTLEGETTDGMFTVHGTTFHRGNLVIEVADYLVEASVTPDGTATTDRGTLIRTGR